MSSRGAVWYKREPRAFLDGVRRLSEREIAVYSIVLDLIYDGGHSTLDDPKHIASYFSDLGAAAVRRAIDALVEAGKLEREGGQITNKRAKNEGKTREELRETRQKAGRLGGISSGKSRDAMNKISDLTEAAASTGVALDKIREDKKKEEPNGSLSGTAVPDPAPKKGSRNEYPADFDAAWLAYPRTPNMSKAEALPEWRKLSAEDRAAAFQSIPGYIKFLKTKPDLETIHFVRYLKKRRFDGFVEAGISTATDDDWLKKLNFGREKREWATSEWGPAPGQPGCRIPEHLLQPGDGAGWGEWKKTRLTSEPAK